MKTIYWLLVRFGWGFGLVSGVLGLIRDIGTILLFLAILFGVKFGLIWDGFIGISSFFAFVGLGEWLKRRGYLDYSAKLSNSINPEIKRINEIYEILKQRQ